MGKNIPHHMIELIKEAMPTLICNESKFVGETPTTLTCLKELPQGTPPNAVVDTESTGLSLGLLPGGTYGYSAMRRMAI